jgi:hypothetical protein
MAKISKIMVKPMNIFYLPEQAMAWAMAMLEIRSLTVVRRLCLLYCCSHSLLTTTRFPTSPTWSVFNRLSHFLQICILLVPKELTNVLNESKFVYFFLAYGYQNYAQFYAGFISMEIIGKKCN